MTEPTAVTSRRRPCHRHRRAALRRQPAPTPRRTPASNRLAVTEPAAITPRRTSRAIATSAPPAGTRRATATSAPLSAAGAGHFARLHPGVELLRGDVAQGQRRVPQGAALGVGALGDLGRLIVADVRGQRGDQHQRVVY